jgi:1-phosphatidylinositol-3-phosphate 5-kinase
MKQYNIDQDKWGQKLIEFVQTAVDSVRPSSRLLQDSMNFNNFIKIKIINWRDNSKSAYINGVVMNKNIADKRMISTIQNPSILLLKESIGTMKNDGLTGSAGLTEIQSIVDQEEHWIEIIRQKLTQVKPNIIIVEKDVGYKILDALRESQITVISNMNHHKMKRIQRFTQTIISPSYNVIDKSFVLGKCKQFRVEAPFTGG